MSGLSLMWRNTRMVVLCAISAALYAAVLIPFKVVPLIPGVTEMRPANAIPVVCSFLFGPAAAWGAAIGNLIGDFFGAASPGDIFGFFGNFVYGLVPFKMWEIIGGGASPISRSPLNLVRYFACCLAASTLCAALVGWGDNVLVIRPFVMLGNVIILNNMISALALSPFILAAVYPRVSKGRLLYTDLMPELKARPMPVRIAGLAMLLAGEGGAWLFGNLISTGYWEPHFLPAWMLVAPYDKPVMIIVGPFILLAFVGLFLM
ncbi:MAG TPA: QueT transporter family protein [Candidatus Binataceae bacterium]|nr:QueT transporter family protein [Candidatus Binataceae bacterium]